MRDTRSLLIDAMREVSVLVVVFGVLDGVKGAYALALAIAVFGGAVLLQRF